MALFVLGLWGMRNLVIVISVVFVAIIAVSYFYFSNLDEKVPAQLHETVSEEVGPEPAEPQANNGALWAFDLNGGAIGKPSVHLYSDSTRFILVQDAYHILHAISPDGQKLWNAQLPGPIVDSISQLADHSLVFTTAERLYRIDTAGDPLPGFSLTLPQQATEGATATSNQGTVRIEVATSRQVLSYDGRGKLLRRQARSRNGTPGNTDHVEHTQANLPHDCDPLAYIGPLYDDGERYLLCSKGSQKLYCFRY